MPAVTVGSIRWRILKVDCAERMVDRLAMVTVGSIRWRILKERRFAVPLTLPVGYSGLDPMEDTESGPGATGLHRPASVTVGSIRWRRVGGVPTAYAEITF